MPASDRELIEDLRERLRQCEIRRADDLRASDQKAVELLAKKNAATIAAGFLLMTLIVTIAGVWLRK